MTARLDAMLSATGPEAFQDPAQRRLELGRDIVAAAYLRGDFVLSSGTRSRYYFDKYLFETKPTVLRRLVSLLAERLPRHVDRLAGPELGSVALTAALSLESGLPFLIVRKQPKAYGTAVPIEGEYHPGERVLVVEDVVSTGGEALAAVEKLRAAGIEVASVLAVIDREQGGAAALAATGLSLDALFTLTELMEGTAP